MITLGKPKENCNWHVCGIRAVTSLAFEALPPRRRRCQSHVVVRGRDESILGIPMAHSHGIPMGPIARGSHRNPMGMGIVTPVSWEMGMGMW